MTTIRMTKNKLNIIQLLKTNPSVPSHVIEECTGMLKPNLNRLLKQMTEQGLISRESEIVSDGWSLPYRRYVYSLPDQTYPDYWFEKELNRFEPNVMMPYKDFRNPTDVVASLQTLNELSGQVSTNNQKLLEEHVESLTRYLDNTWVTDVIGSIEKKVLKKGIIKARKLGLDRDADWMELKLQDTKACF